MLSLKNMKKRFWHGLRDPMAVLHGFAEYKPSVLLKILYLQRKGSTTYYVAWDTERDVEVESYESEDVENVLLHGQSSALGYLVNSRNEVVSLATSIIRTLYKTSMKGRLTAPRVMLQMSANEEYFLFGSNVQLRYNLAQFLYAEELKELGTLLRNEGSEFPGVPDFEGARERNTDMEKCCY